MMLGGLALAFSRLIDNSVVVLENIFRHLEMGEAAGGRRRKGRQEVALPVLAATLTTVVVFFPGHVPLRRQPVPVYGAGAGGGAVPVRLLFRGDDRGAAVLREVHQGPSGARRGRERRRAEGLGHAVQRAGSTASSSSMLDRYDGLLNLALLRPAGHGARASPALFVFSLALYPLIGKAYFPRTDPGQFVINLKAPTGTRIELTDQLVATGRAASSAKSVPPEDLSIIVSNIGVTPGFSSIYTPQLRSAHRLRAGGLATTTTT